MLVSPCPASVDVDYLGTRASDGQSIYTAPCRNRYATTTQLDAEQHILTTAADGRPQLVHPERAEAAAATATADGQLSGGQAAALAALLASATAVTVLRAAAGTGKTRLVGTFAKAWTEATGGRVHVVTVSENAARVAAAEMDAAGAEVRAANLARFLGKQPDGTIGRRTEVGGRDVIVLDEASQVATADWLHLADTAARSGARIIAVGDEYQLGAIGAGGVFTLLADRHGALELHEVHRFASEWEKQASLALRDGDVGVIADYQVQGRIFPAPEDLAIRNVVLDWAADIHAGKDALMIAQTEAEVTELNRQAAEHLARIREADGWRPGPERIGLADGNHAQTGDWIQARLNDHLITADGQWLANRDILQVGRIYGFGSDRQVEVRRRQPDGSWSKPFTLPAAYAQQHATLGYASTVYAAQGRTADTAHALVTAGMNRETLYVAATRGRDENRLHVVTGQPGSEHQATPEAVLGQALATPASEQRRHHRNGRRAGRRRPPGPADLPLPADHCRPARRRPRRRDPGPAQPRRLRPVPRRPGPARPPPRHPRSPARRTRHRRDRHGDHPRRDDRRPVGRRRPARPPPAPEPPRTAAADWLGRAAPRSPRRRPGPPGRRGHGRTHPDHRRTARRPPPAVDS